MQTDPSISYSLNLISLEKYFDEMVKLHESNNFPKVFLLNGQKGIGKFTLVMHFLNYIYSMDETTKYNIKNKLVNIKSKTVILSKSLFSVKGSPSWFRNANSGTNFMVGS